jgi:hypothetical protein
MPQAWTDARLDERFDRIDSELNAFREESRSGFAAAARRFDGIDTRLDGIDTRLDRMDTRLDGNQRALLQGALILSGSMMTGVIALFSLIATKL